MRRLDRAVGEVPRGRAQRLSEDESTGWLFPGDARHYESAPLATPPLTSRNARASRRVRCGPAGRRPRGAEITASCIAALHYWATARLGGRELKEGGS